MPPANPTRPSVESVAFDLGRDCGEVKMQFRTETLEWFARWAIRFANRRVREELTRIAHDALDDSKGGQPFTRQQISDWLLSLASRLPSPPAASESSELLPCPFCGGRAARHSLDEPPASPSFGGEVIGCDDCGASTVPCFPDKGDTLSHLMLLWNRRARFVLDTCRVAHEANAAMIDAGEMVGDNATVSELYTAMELARVAAQAAPAEPSPLGNYRERATNQAPSVTNVPVTPPAEPAAGERVDPHSSIYSEEEVPMGEPAIREDYQFARFAILVGTSNADRLSWDAIASNLAKQLYYRGLSLDEVVKIATGEK